MTLVLAPELEQLIAKKIESGEYNSPDEVIAYALHLVNEQEAVNTRLRVRVRGHAGHCE